MSTNALQAFTGAKAAARTLAGTVGGLDRVQEVHTPAWVLDAARTALGGAIALDPCALLGYGCTIPDLGELEAHRL